MPARSSGSSSSSSPRSAARFSTISWRRGSPDWRASSIRRSMPARSCSTTSCELLGDLVVDAAEVAVLELLLAALAEPLEHLAHAHELLAVAVLEALLEHPAQRRVEVAVVHQLVGHLVEQGVGVEVEAHLGAVPRRVPEGGSGAAGAATAHAAEGNPLGRCRVGGRRGRRPERERPPVGGEQHHRAEHRRRPRSSTAAPPAPTESNSVADQRREDQPADRPRRRCTTR